MESVTKIQIENEETVTLPDGVSLVTDQSFIRLELAAEIINTYNANLKPIVKS